MIQTHAPSSQDGYRRDLIRIREWMGDRPIDRDSVCEFLTVMRSVKAPNTLHRYLSSIKHDFHSRGEPSPTHDPKVMWLMTEIVAESYHEVHHAKPLTEELIRDCIEQTPERPIGMRNRAVLTVGWRAAPIERAALTRLEVRDVEPTYGGWRVTTSQRGRPLVVTGKSCLPGDHDLWDAVRKWREERDISSGPLWLGGDRHGNFQSEAFSPQTVTLILKEALERLGKDSSGYSSNSLKTLAR